MDPSSTISFFYLFLLILLSAFFSGAETALVGLSPAKVQALLQNKEKSAHWIHYLKSKPHKMLLIILIFNNLVNIGAAAYATVVFINMFGAYGAGIATAVMTLAIMIFGEIIPKSVANKHPVGVSQFVSKPLVVLGYLAWPVVFVFEKFLIKLVGKHMYSVSEDEVMAMVSMGAEDGSLEKHEKELIENVLEFNDISVEDVMTPRTSVFALSVETTIKDAIREAAEASHSRIPVYKENLDNIIGFTTVKKLLQLSMDESQHEKTLGEIDLYQFIKVPTTKKIHSLFSDFQRRRTHIALIFDEHGGTEGIVTMEDILEEIVGEIIDENDEDEPDAIVRKDADTLILEGDAEIGDIERMLDTEIANYENVDKISWVILDQLSRFPKLNEEIIIGGAKFKVVEMDSNSNKITKVQAVKYYGIPTE